jgi:hypothetical protein
MDCQQIGDDYAKIGIGRSTGTKLFLLQDM